MAVFPWFIGDFKSHAQSKLRLLGQETSVDDFNPSLFVHLAQNRVGLLFFHAEKGAAIF